MSSLREWALALPSQGRYTFTTADARAAGGGASEAAVAAALGRAEADHLIASPVRGFHVPDLPVGNSAVVPTYELDELLATKLRALYQRRKGRDLFDLWWAHEQADPDPAGSSRSSPSTRRRPAAR